jgi:hypothetical protein
MFTLVINCSLNRSLKLLNVKGKMIAVYAIKANKGINSFFTWALDGDEIVNITPLLLYSRRKNPRYLLNPWLDEAQDRSGRFGEESKSFSSRNQTQLLQLVD